MRVAPGHGLAEYARRLAEIRNRMAICDINAHAAGWRLQHVQPSSRYVNVPRSPRFDSFLAVGADNVNTSMVETVQFEMKRYAVNFAFHAHPKDTLALWNAGADTSMPVRAAVTLAEKRAFYHDIHDRPSAWSSSWRRYWQANAPYWVTVTFRSDGVALDSVNKTVYVNGPSPYWPLVFDVWGFDLLRAS